MFRSCLEAVGVWVSFSVFDACAIKNIEFLSGRLCEERRRGRRLEQEKWIIAKQTKRLSKKRASCESRIQSVSGGHGYIAFDHRFLFVKGYRMNQ